MNPEDNNQTPAEPQAPANPEAPAAPQAPADSITIPRAEYDKIVAEHGSFKRELKDLKKPKEEPAAPQPSDDLVKLGFLRSAGITDKDEVDLALSTADKWKVGLNQLIDDEDFKGKLERLRTKKANELATSGINGGPGNKGEMNAPEFYIARGTPPTREEVADRATRVKIVNAMRAAEQNSGKFYNDPARR